MYKIIALIGEAGSGKDRIMSEVLASRPALFNEIISCTTRPMREGEAEGINYYYLTEEEFIDRLLDGQMLEATNFNGWYYGTSYEALRSDVPNIGVFNPAGIYALLEREDIELTVFRIITLSKTRLLRQLNREENPNTNEIVRRFMTDTEDFSELNFDYIKIANENELDLQNAVNQILNSVECSGGQGQK